MRAAGDRRQTTNRPDLRAPRPCTDPWGDEPTARPSSLGVRTLWSGIAGYAVLAGLAVFADMAAGGIFSTTAVHLLGGAGAAIFALFAVRSHDADRPARPVRSANRPHDGWIS